MRSTGNGQPCLWFSNGCTIGCKKCDGISLVSNGKSLCETTMVPTINDPKLRTMNRWAVAGSEDDSYRFHPWRAPGTAPVDDACGRAGGGTKYGPGEAVFADNK